MNPFVVVVAGMSKQRRGSTLAAWALGAGLVCLALVIRDATRLERTAPAAECQTGIGFADPALFNEARYARHASQADLHAPFQDHPLALERFPAGSLMPPPRP
ncbi:MAG: hypothetical protein MUC79_02820 [Thiobacillaceae bacterium]|jgi:hypothetical protein|nr:hypothetical protein [Thiobacillaceae bacterium]